MHVTGERELGVRDARTDLDQLGGDLEPVVEVAGVEDGGVAAREGERERLVVAEPACHLHACRTHGVRELLVGREIHLEPERREHHVAARDDLTSHAFLELGAERLEPVVETIVSRDHAERRQARRHRERIARHRPRLVHRARRGDLCHQLSPAAIGANRQTAADDLAQRREVGRHAIALLSAASRHTEPGHHLVEDQERAVGGGELAQVLQEVPTRARRPPCCRRPAPR